MRQVVDPTHIELTTILDALINEDFDISYQEIARRHSILKAASDFSRNSSRRTLVEAYLLRQSDARSVRVGPTLEAATSLKTTVENQKVEIDELRDDIRCLIAATSACIRAVYLSGGTNSLEKFWLKYKEVAEVARRSGAMPVASPVIELSRPSDPRV